MHSMQSSQTISNPGRRRDILLLTLTCTGILGLLVRSAILAVTGFLNFDPQSSTSLSASVLGALAMLFCAGLLTPVLGYTVKRLRGLALPPAVIQPIKFWQVAVFVATWGLVVIIGAWLSSLFSYGWAVAAPLLLLGISLPILTLAWIGAGGLTTGSLRRLWSAFGYGMVGATLTALVLEYLLVGIAVLGIGVIASANPALRSTLDQIQTLVTNAKTGDMQALLTVLAPYITNPLVILSILVFAAVLAPMIEEAAKPAVIWLLGKRLRSPAEGFALGVICGAGFAMMEGLLAASSGTQMWGFSLVGRAPASLMHMTASGLMGWAIASTQTKKRTLQLGMIYVLSVSIHGLWNGSAIMAVYGALRMMVQNTQFDFLSISFSVVGVGMLLMELIVMIAVLPTVNRRLRQPSALVPVPVQSDIIAPLTTSDSRETNGLDSKNR
jgi:hypothetical protein